MERTTESQEQIQGNAGNGHQTQPLPLAQAPPAPPPTTHAAPPAPAPPTHAAPPAPAPPTHAAPPAPAPPTHAAPPAPAPPTHAVPAGPAPAAPNGYDRCPSCGALVAADQRYCLECGQRHGDPRLPFMDAVVFMDAMKQPNHADATPPSKKARRRISPNAALIAGVGTLLLALGIGVLIGRSGNGTTASAPATPQIVTVGGGASEGTTSSKTGQTTIGGDKSGKPKSKAATKKAAKKVAETNAGAEEVLKPAGDVKLPPPTTGVGDKCEKGTAGCENGKFTGNFFGE
jgi:hypothetical protein